MRSVRSRFLLLLPPLLSLSSLFSFFLLVAATTGCGSRATTPRVRVASDLGCTAEQTGVRKLSVDSPQKGYTRWEVQGCGKLAIYVCTTPVRDCWREGQIQEHRSVSPPSAPDEDP
jgi:hypothetical protein